MKTMNRVLIAAAVAAVLGIGSTVRAQAYSAVGDDGIAASPKVRAQLNERAVAALPAPSRTVAAVPEKTTKPAAPAFIAASPKVAQMFAEREAWKKTSAPSANFVSTTAPANDGIVASPKVRQQLNERGQKFEIAPVK